MTTPEFSADTVRELRSRRRLEPYLDRSDGDPRKALELHEWSTRMAAAAFETVAHLEVMVRNAIDAALSDHYDDAGCGIPWFLRRPPMNDETMSSIDSVRARLRPLGRDTRHQIIAGLSFGFWSGMVGKRYEDLWRAALRHAFPRSSGNREQITAALEAIRKFWNKIAHHDSMLNVDIPFELRRVLEVADFVSADAAAWLAGVDRTPDVYRARPCSPIDTAVIPARDAWPFYADREIKAELPRILHRRDHVPWSAHEAARLETSDDRMDRKVAAVIAASRNAGWEDGLNQVFLLSRPGDSAHRTLPAPVRHEPTGRGSAFVQRQRYFSLHALETAATTADLRRETRG